MVQKKGMIQRTSNTNFVFQWSRESIYSLSTPHPSMNPLRSRVPDDLMLKVLSRRRAFVLFELVSITISVALAVLHHYLQAHENPAVCMYRQYSLKYSIVII